MGLNMANLPSDLVVPCILLGILIHLSLFIRGEWHLQAPAIVIIHAAAFSILFVSRVFFNPTITMHGLLDPIVPIIAYLGGLYGSMTVYRIFFHGLRVVPGPRLAALSKLWHVWKCRDSRGHLVLDDWHHKYGNIVRTGMNPLGSFSSHHTKLKLEGPNEVTLFRPDAFEILDGPRNRNSRSDWYDLLHPRISSIFTRDKELHKGRRKLWEHIMAPACEYPEAWRTTSYPRTHQSHCIAVAQYHQSIIAKVQELDRIISQNGTKPLYMNDLIHWFAFDSMGAFGFGIEFGLMKHQGPNDGFLNMRSALGLLGPFTPLLLFGLRGLDLLSSQASGEFDTGFRCSSSLITA